MEKIQKPRAPGRVGAASRTCLAGRSAEAPHHGSSRVHPPPPPPPASRPWPGARRRSRFSPASTQAARGQHRPSPLGTPAPVWGRMGWRGHRDVPIPSPLIAPWAARRSLAGESGVGRGWDAGTAAAGGIGVQGCRVPRETGTAGRARGGGDGQGERGWEGTVRLLTRRS